MKATITLLLVLFTSIATFGQTTETRYYNGKYTKETALKKANDFFNLKNGEKTTFTKMDKKSDYQFIGNWIIKSEAENLQSQIEYLFEDDGLKIKINEIVLNDKYGALKMDKNHKDEVARKTAENLYVSINDLFVKAVFVYLDIDNNTTPTTTTAGAKASGQTTTENDVPIHKITATFTANTKLSVRKLDDNTFHYYQNDKRINAPLRQEVITKDELLSKGQRLELFCSYGDDYNFYCPHDVQDIEKNALYSMFQNKKINYLYVYQNNVGTLSLNYHNEMLDKTDYEVYTPKGNENYMFLKTKKDNDFFVAEKKQLSKYRKDVLKSVNVPNSNNYLLILQDNDEFVFLEPGKPTQKKGWRLEQKEDTEKYYLINDQEKIKYYAYGYNKLLKQGFAYLNKDTY